MNQKKQLECARIMILLLELVKKTKNYIILLIHLAKKYVIDYYVKLLNDS